MMEVVDQQPAPARQQGRLRKLLIKVLWSLLRMLWGFLVPLLRIVLLLSLMGVISVICYYLLHRALLPKSLLEEPLYFDFSLSPPMARVSLLSHEKQWFYISDCLKRTQRRSGSRQRRASTETCTSAESSIEGDSSCSSGLVDDDSGEDNATADYDDDSDGD